ncbi:MAG: DUF6879 family protein [Micromonosporaceae bacterium]
MRLDGDTWQEFFDSFEREAFRLETLPVYRVEGERSEYQRFLDTGGADIRDDDPWWARVRHYRETDRWIGRVHIVSRPLTDYLRFEFAFYRHSVLAGEEVRILDVTDQPDPGLPQQDFWMFDESRVVRMDYEADGAQVGRELLEGVDPAPYVAWKHLALEHSEPFTEYSARLRA